jgi:hypothetical protein
VTDLLRFVRRSVGSAEKKLLDSRENVDGDWSDVTGLNRCGWVLAVIVGDL